LQVLILYCFLFDILLINITRKKTQSLIHFLIVFRQGLINASGTKLQVNGAAYGKGIYLSPHISTSMGYSRMGYGYHKVTKGAQQQQDPNAVRFLSGSNITCIAICEVITSKCLKKSNSIWVCPNQDYVCTRFFFVYEDGQVCDSSIDTQQSKYLEVIQKACSQRWWKENAEISVKKEMRSC